MIRTVNSWAYWTPERMIASVHEWVDAFGQPPKADNWRVATPENPCCAHVRHVFGSWSELIVRSGFPRPGVGMPAFWTQEKAVAAILRFNADNGRPPQVREMATTAGGLPHWQTIRKLFGTHRAALEAAGLICPSGGGPVRWTEDLIAAAMLDFVLRTGRWPTRREWQRSGALAEGRPTSRTVCDRFGSWGAAKRYAGYIDTPEAPLPPAWACGGCGCDDPDTKTIACVACVNRHSHRKIGPAASSRVENREGGAVPLYKPTERRKSQLVTARSDKEGV